MPTTLLTSRAVQVAKPARNAAGEPVRAEIPDGMGLGLYLAIEATGAKSWILRCRDRDGRSLRRKLGDVDTMTLTAARAEAAKMRHQVEQRPAPAKAQPVVSQRGDRIESAIAEFLEKHAFAKTRASTAAAAERALARLVLPAWRGRTIDSIRRRDVIDLVEKIAEENGGYMSNRVLGVLSKFFNWLVARDRLEASPVAGVERVHQEQARNRTLSDDEVRALWLAAEGDQFGPALRLLLICGARRNEVSLMTYDELDDEGNWTLPASRTKNGIEHTIKLSRQALGIIEAQPRLAGCPYVFPGRVGRTGLIGWDKSKKRISKKAGIAEASWRLHDLRRSCASGMQRLGIPVAVVEKALNHKSGTFRGIVGVYQQHDYQHEIADALQQWADHVDAIVAGKSADVISIRRKRK